MQKVYIHTFGCQMNEYDSERMEAAVAGDAGFTLVRNEEEADVIIVNTCSVRKHAEERAMSYVGRHVRDKKVIIAGCMAQSLKKELKRQFVNLHAVVGTFRFDEIGDIIKKGGVYTDEDHNAYSVNISRTGKVRGFTAIMQGCNNFCSYCIVPFVRGREKSRAFAEISSEIGMLAKNGMKEVTLLGQNVNSYSDEGMNFPALLRELVKIPGLERLRFMTSHPKDLNEELINTVAANRKLCKHFHLPVQSGSDRMLMAMNRKYTTAEYKGKVMMIREKIPGCAITTDILSGFPGETEQDFRETVSLINEVKFDDAYVFKYSVRPGTAAEKLKDDVAEIDKKKRVNYILDLQKKISEDINNKLVGTETEALVYLVKSGGNQEARATTDTNKRVYMKNTQDLTGLTVRVRIIEARPGSLTGEVVK
jgi:tRNA-2-methylthio-N6-dimethylallyladenosine synthase